MAASLTKSIVAGATPNMELTPVYSPRDWASTGVEMTNAAAMSAYRFMDVILWGMVLKIVILEMYRGSSQNRK
jgi:hypothetical protein